MECIQDASHPLRMYEMLFMDEASQRLHAYSYIGRGIASRLLYSPHRLLHRKLTGLRAAFPCSAKREHTSQELGTLCTSTSGRSSYYLPATNMPHKAQGSTPLKIWSMRCIEPPSIRSLPWVAMTISQLFRNISFTKHSLEFG